jgi:hypothetical protein
MRQPMRETRGFSRAQTGDGVTAVLPLTWSITMLMHASTHSINFDENTSGTIFTLTVIAYQWGWNYYFPRDIVEVCWNAPKQVGHGGVDHSQDHNYYDRLLNYTQQNMTTKFANEFRFASKTGKNVAPNIFSLFVKPTHLSSNFSCALPLFNTTSTFGTYTSTILSDSTSAGRKLNMLPSELINARLVELLDEGGMSVSSGFDSQITDLSLSAPVTLINFNSGTSDLTSQTAGRGLSSYNSDYARMSNATSLNQSHDYVTGFSKFVVREDMLRYRLSDALRGKSTAVLSSNRLLLIYKNYMELLSHNSAMASTSGTANGVDLLDALAGLLDIRPLRERAAFILRKTQIADMQGNTVLSFLPPEFNTGLFGQHGLAVSNVGVGFWPFFFNIERYLTCTNAGVALMYNSNVALFSGWCSTLAPRVSCTVTAQTLPVSL